MEKIIVSSQMNKVVYDEVKEELFITFNNDKVYKYDNVPLDVYLALIASESVGSFFIRNIKNNPNYKFQLIN